MTALDVLPCSLEFRVAPQVTSLLSSVDGYSSERYSAYLLTRFVVGPCSGILLKIFLEFDCDVSQAIASRTHCSSLTFTSFGCFTMDSLDVDLKWCMSSPFKYSI